MASKSGVGIDNEIGMKSNLKRTALRAIARLANVCAFFLAAPAFRRCAAHRALA
jgi:hypothetical protein